MGSALSSKNAKPTKFTSKPIDPCRFTFKGMCKTRPSLGITPQPSVGFCGETHLHKGSQEQRQLWQSPLMITPSGVLKGCLVKYDNSSNLGK